jgi:hypothetical protein
MEDIVDSILRNNGSGIVFLHHLETEPSRSEMVRPAGMKKKEAKMPVLDSAIAYYLCGIMVVLGLITVIGASRQHINKNKK